MVHCKREYLPNDFIVRVCLQFEYMHRKCVPSIAYNRSAVWFMSVYGPITTHSMSKNFRPISFAIHLVNWQTQHMAGLEAIE